MQAHRESGATDVVDQRLEAVESGLGPALGSFTVFAHRVELPRGIDISAYRIVQEGLTNALKHAHATRADVDLEYRADQLRIEVRDNGHGVAIAGNGHGHGLIGIGERVKLYGGEMSTASENGGGFTLSARLPLTEYRS